MCDFGIPNCLVDADVFRLAPELVHRVRCALRQNPIAEHQATAVMDCKGSILAEDLIPFRHTEAAAPGAERVSRVVAEHTVVVRLDDGAVIHPDVVDRPDIAPVQRFLQTTPVVDEHDSDGATIQPGPLDGGHCRLLEVQLFQRLLVEVNERLIRHILQGEAVFHSFLRRGVDDLGEQPVAFVEQGQEAIRHLQFRDILVLLRRVFRGAVLRHQVHEAVCPVRPDGLSALPSDQVSIAAEFLHLGVPSAVVCHAVVTSFIFHYEVSAARLKALRISISVKPLAEASTMSLNFPSGKFSS